MRTIDTAHTTYLAHLQASLSAAHAWQVTCHAAGTASAPPAEPERAALPRALATAPAVQYLRIAWGVTVAKKRLAEIVRERAEVASQGRIHVPTYGPGYAGGAGRKPVTFDRYDLASLDEIGASLARGEANARKLAGEDAAFEASYAAHLAYLSRA